jgi:hypothetical protein
VETLLPDQIYIFTQTSENEEQAVIGPQYMSTRKLAVKLA